jgi:hypothetical protein
MMDRRTAIKWMATAAAAMPLLNLRSLGDPAPAARQGYGMDPDLGKSYRTGELWPLTLTAAQRAAVGALCDVIIPADGESPSASAVGVPDFIDEWISAPYGDPAYPDAGNWPFAADRKLLLWGIGWLDEESVGRYGRPFSALTEGERTSICDEICFEPQAPQWLGRQAVFFTRFRDLVAGGYYTTPAGRKDVKYVGNVPLSQFDGPPPDVIRAVGLIP